MALGLVAAMALVPTGIAGGAPSSPDQVGRDVTVDAEVGLGGVVPAAVAVPVRVAITSSRAREAVLELQWEGGSRRLDVELSADAPTEVDLAIGSSPWLEIDVRTPSGQSLADRTASIDPDPDHTVVGIGPTLASQGAPSSSPTIGEIQDAALVGLTDELWRRPGSMGAMSGIVLAGADLDALDQEQRDALREWVWSGGDLALDVEPRDRLPVLDLPSVGAATPVGAGWVRFTGGQAAAGAWSAIVEPSTIRTGAGALAGVDMGMGMGGFVDWDFLGLIRVGFLPTWVIALSVFGTALVAGPLVWFALRDRRRRRWMWVAAPGISMLVAVTLLVAGQGVFTSASSRVVADVRSSAWSSSGTVLSGLKDTTVLDLPPGAEVINSTPDASVSNTGDGRVARIDLPRNAFGSIGVSPVTLDDGPRLEVSAVASTDGTAQVSVTNVSTGTLTDVHVTGNGRTRNFSDVGPGATESLPFEVAQGLPLFGPMFPAAQDAMMTMSDVVGGTALTGVPDSRGLVMITGFVISPVRAVGLSGDGVVSISAMVPITSAAPDDAAVRIDTLGGLSFDQLQAASDQAEFGGPNGQGLDEDIGATPTTIEGPAGSGTQPGEDGAEPLPTIPPDYVRVSFPGGRGAGPCGMHTSATELSIWNGSGWEALDKVGDPYPSERIEDINGDGGEMQSWQLPAIGAGERIHLRIGGRVLPTPPALLFDCGPRP